MLKIKVLNRIPKLQDPEDIYLKWKGRIYFGISNNPYEDLYMNSCTWTLEQYEQQWKEGLKRIKSHSSSCLIANISIEAVKANEIYTNMDIYYLYKADNKILIQRQFFFPRISPDLMDDLLPFNPFDFDKRYENLPVFDPELETYEVNL